jgi:hypothetical protein
MDNIFPQGKDQQSSEAQTSLCTKRGGCTLEQEESSHRDQMAPSSDDSDTTSRTLHRTRTGTTL